MKQEDYPCQNQHKALKAPVWNGQANQPFENFQTLEKSEPCGISLERGNLRTGICTSAGSAQQNLGGNFGPAFRTNDLVLSGLG